MTLHRFLVGPESRAGSTVTFPPHIGRQIARVLRLQPGSAVVAFDGTSLEYVVRLEDVGRSVTGTVVEERRNRAEPAVALTLLVGMLKRSKLEWVVQKGTELGVRSFVPVRTARTVRDDLSMPRLDRLRAIAQEATEQSGRGIVPTVEAPAEFQAAIGRATFSGPAYLLWEGEQEMPLTNAVAAGDSRACLIVGPEGGFTDEEVTLARAAGCRTVSLGPRILRAETAAVAGAALLLAAMGEMEPR